MHGIPDKVPSLYYMRVPLWRVEPESYLDWKRRRAGFGKLLQGTQMEIKKIELEVDRIAWEGGLRARPDPTPDELALHTKIIQILKGTFVRLVGADGAVELRDRALRSDTPFKAQNYEMAIRSIESHPGPIKSGKEAMVLPGVGPKTAEKIQEIIETVNLYWSIVNGRAL